MLPLAWRLLPGPTLVGDEVADDHLSGEAVAVFGKPAKEANELETEDMAEKKRRCIAVSILIPCFLVSYFVFYVGPSVMQRRLAANQAKVGLLVSGREE